MHLLLSLLDCRDWSSVDCSDISMDTRLEHLSQKIMDVVDQLDPLKHVSSKKNPLLTELAVRVLKE